MRRTSRPPLGRWALAAAAALLGGLLAVLTLGLVEAGDPLPGVPATFGVAAPQVGDRGAYNATVIERTPDGVTPLSPDWTVARFEWRPPRDLYDSLGAAHRANVLQWDDVRIASDRTGLKGPSRPLDDAPPTTAYFYDAATGDRFARGHLKPDGAGWTGFSYLAPESSYADGPVCGFLNPLQGRRVAMEERWSLFRDCDFEVSGWGRGRLQAFAPEEIDGESCLVFARKGAHWWATGDDAETYVWYCPHVPYPVRVAVEDGKNPDRFLVYRLAAFSRGDTRLDGPEVRPSMPPAPDVAWAPARPHGPSEAGVDPSFSLGDAWRHAANDPTAPALRDFVAAHPDAYMTHAEHHAFTDGATTQSYWWFLARAGTASLPVGVLQESRPGQLAEYRYANQTDIVQDFAAAFEDPFDAVQRPPDVWPTVASLDRLWRAYAALEGIGGAASEWGFHTESTIAGCTGDGPRRVCVPDVVLEIGNRRATQPLDAARLRGFAGAPTEEGATLGVRYHADDGTLLVTGFGVRDLAAQAWAPAEPAPVGALDALALDVGWWRMPPTTVWFGAGLFGLGLGALVGAWPWAKQAAGFALFSRVERPQALHHAGRAQLMELVSSQPGIHQQAIQRALGWGSGTTRHHLHKLVQVGLVVEHAGPGYTCYFPKARTDRRSMQAAAVLKSTGARQVLDAIVKHAGATGRQLVDATGLDRATVWYHVRRLEAAQLVAVHRRQGAYRCTATPWARQTYGATAGTTRSPASGSLGGDASTRSST